MEILRLLYDSEISGSIEVFVDGICVVACDKADAVAKSVAEAEAGCI